VARQGRPHSGPPHFSRFMERAREGRCESIRTGRLLLHPGPEWGIQGRLFSDHDFEPLRPPGLGGDRLSRPRHAAARQFDDLGRNPGQGAEFRGRALRRREGLGPGQGNRVPRERGSRRGHRIVGGDSFAGASAACGHRPSRRSARSRDRGCRQCAGGGTAADGPPVDLGIVVHQARVAAQRHDPTPYSAGITLFIGDRRGAGRRHVRRQRFEIGLARGRRADRLAARGRL